MKIYHVIPIKFDRLAKEKCPHDRKSVFKLSDHRVTNISNSFNRKMAAKTSWHRHMERNYVSVTLCSTMR